MYEGSAMESLCICAWIFPYVMLGCSPSSSKSEKWILGEIRIATTILILSDMNIFTYAFCKVRKKFVDLKNVSSFTKYKGTHIECLALCR